MICPHARANDELPCPWPDCPDGTPQQAVVLLRGEQAVVTAKQHHSMSVEADDGVELWRRRRTASGWEWIRQQE